MGLPLGDPFEWAAQGNCRGADRDIFFPIRNDAAKIKAAKNFCNSCPVRQPCLTFALQNPDTEGIWGSTTQRERDRMRSIYGAGLGSLMASWTSDSSELDG